MVCLLSGSTDAHRTILATQCPLTLLGMSIQNPSNEQAHQTTTTLRTPRHSLHQYPWPSPFTVRACRDGSNHRVESSRWSLRTSTESVTFSRLSTNAGVQVSAGKPANWTPPQGYVCTLSNVRRRREEHPTPTPRQANTIMRRHNKNPRGSGRRLLSV